MARETKIGLLVGMGFIVCFAIILSNRGTDNPANVRRAIPPVVDANDANASPQVAERRARDYGTQARVPDPRETRSAPRPHPDSVGAPQPQRLPGLNPAETTAAATHRTGPTRTLSDVIPVDRSSAASITPPEPGRSPISTASHTRRPADEKDRLTATLPAESPTGTEAAAPRREYTVSSGDSLSKIAQKAYGTRLKSVIDAIYDANRDQLTSPDHLKVGQTLVLPEINGIAPKVGTIRASSRSPSRAARPVKTETARDKTATRHSSRGEQQTWRWYQVRKGDRYETIARRELGDGSRWKEIYELNKAVFPDSSKIRWGVRIKIPNDPKQ